jgi:endonuclease YncB( thermonuclease family)
LTVEAPLFAVLALASVADGDTLTLRDASDRVTIRLAEIDAPERTQPYAQASRRNLLALCGSATDVRYEKVDTDVYGRTVAHVWCDGVHVNWRQVEDGLAWCFTKYLRHPEQCNPLEQQAREQRRGLWREDQPVAPWDFRAFKRDIR